MLIEIRLVAVGKTRTNSVAFLWREKGGERRCAMFFDLELTKYARAALRKLTQDGMLIAHSALQQFMTRHLGTYVERVTIPSVRESHAYRMVVHFHTPAGPIEEDFLPSDAVAMALYADCPVLIEEAILELAAPHAPTPEQLGNMTSALGRMEEAEEKATTLPKDKLPQS